MIRYPAIIDGEKGAYGVVIPDLPGACAMGATVDEALANAEDMLIDYVSVVEEGEETIASPSAIEDVELQAGEMLAFVVLKVTTPAS